MQVAVSAFFFCSFFVMCSFVLQNLVIAVIVDNFIESNAGSGSDQGDHEYDFCEVAHRKMILDRFTNLLNAKLAKSRRGELA